MILAALLLAARLQQPTFVLPVVGCRADQVQVGTAPIFWRITFTNFRGVKREIIQSKDDVDLALKDCKAWFKEQSRRPKESKK